MVVNKCIFNPFPICFTCNFSCCIYHPTILQVLNFTVKIVLMFVSIRVAFFYIFCFTDINQFIKVYFIGLRIIATFINQVNTAISRQGIHVNVVTFKIQFKFSHILQFYCFYFSFGKVLARERCKMLGV